MDRGRNNHSR